jgi:glycosyltransferase involved in cell wall biosynthesis
LPVWNEQDVLPEFHRRLAVVADGLDGNCEFVFVDDGSTDRSRELLFELHERDPRVRVVSLSRNFGHQIAISAGLDFAQGDAVVIMDTDLQDPPELVPEMIERWREGYEVVYARRGRRSGESRLKLATAHLFYRLLDRSSDVELQLDTGDFRLIDRRVAEIVRNMREPNRYLRGMFAWVGFRQTSVNYDRDERFAGETKYSLARMLRFATDGLLGFSTAPLRMVMALGFAISALAFIGGIWAVVLKLAGAYTTPGWASLTVIVTFLAGIQLSVLGMVGLYVGRIYEQGKQRPLYLIAETRGFTADPDRPGPPVTAPRAPARPR